MHAHTPPFTKPTGAYDARKLFDETSAIAAEQDARHSMTDAEREAKLRTVAHYIYHAKLLMDDVFPYTSTKRVKETPESVHDEIAETIGIETLARHVPHWHKDWGKGIHAESSYLASFSPNGSRIATAAEITDLRDYLTTEELKGFGIGDVESRKSPHIGTRLGDFLNGAEDPAHPLHHVTLHGPEPKL
jgi:hypothetical protein